MFPERSLTVRLLNRGNWNRFSFCLATLLSKQLSVTWGANKHFRMQ
jgi:hypothetical protein